ncbi:2-hydroxyacyl-CoA dehydratase family protein [Dethiothermospora halolimnae]|uniref:2-hydroxyacyl-CoA dehydratase family protein n=1 Tax=Dethiothermospora halolimnae TaxID=3114390 RepID=UPI003CCC213A
MNTNKIGITTTVPIEILIAAGYETIDLNNVFITSDKYEKYIDIAEREGFPKSLCAWIKGIYGACIYNDIKEVVGVKEGDCSNTEGLIEVLKLKGIKVHPFLYPNIHKLQDVKYSIDNFMNRFDVDLEEVEKTRLRLNKVRKLAREIDRLTYIDNKVRGFENHLYQISLSDFNGNVDKFEAELKDKIKEFKGRGTKDIKLRLGYIGVPPMTGDLYEYVEGFNAHIIYNEVQREFAFPRYDQCKNIYEQYYDYTYPYDIHFRLEDIKKQIDERKLDGLIHYTQAFCHRAIDDIVIKNKIDMPILNIEGDKLNTLDARTKLRIEAFLDMLIDRKEMSK